MEASRYVLPEDLGPVLEALSRERSSGVLRIGTTARPMRSFFLRNGRLILACSNRPDPLTNALLEAGHGGLVGQTTRFPLSFLIPELYAVSADFAAPMAGHLAETFLWSTGTLIFTDDDPEGDDRALPIDLELPAIIEEGRKRRDRWKSATQVLPDPTVRFRRTGDWPERFPRTSGDLQLAALLEGGSSLVDVLCAFREQEYGVMLRVASLVRMHVLEPVSVGAPISDFPRGEFTRAMRAPEVEPAAVRDAEQAALAEARRKVDCGDYLSAYRALINHFGTHPASAECLAVLHVAESAIVRDAREAGLEDEVSLRLAVPINHFVGRTMDAVDAFVLSRFAAGPRTVGGLLEVCPMPPPEVLATVKRFLEEGALRAA